MLRLSIEKKTLLFTFAVLGGLSAYRSYDYRLTGFFVADEFGYAYDAIHGYTYGNRWFFGEMNSAIFHAFNVTTVDKYSLLLPFYLIFWSCLTLYTFYLILRTLDYDRMTIALSLFSSLFLISFVLLSLGFLTEPVGLALALLGSLFLVRFAKRKSDSRISLLYPLAASLSYVAATYTREPYSIFLIAGVVAVVVGARNAKGGSEGRRGNRMFTVASTIAFVVPSAIFLQYPNSDLSGSIAIVIADFANLFSHPSGIQSPSTVIANSPMIYSSLPSRLLNTSKIFAFGLVLGWGPLLIGLFLLSFLLMLRGAPKLNRENRVVLILSLLALASYLIVSYIFSPDPTFLSFQNYSTIIRFSDTALPAYFLVAPLGVSIIAGKKNYWRTMVAVLILFLLLAVPAYETYASSNLTHAGGNPFSLDYRTSAAQIRDYVLAHQSDAPFNIVGIPPGWIFTPGVEDLHQVQVFAPAPIPITLSHVGLFYERLLIPYLSYNEFIRERWTTFYVFGANITGAYDQNPGYAIQFINPNAHLNATYSQSFVIVSRQIIMQSPNTVFVKIQLLWK